MKNFHKITDNLYRGAAPNEHDLKHLKNIGVERIVSLDEKTGESIDALCHALNLEHVKVYFNLLPHVKKNIDDVSEMNWKDILLSKPTFLHCLHGKDRTGFVSALVKIKYLGVPASDAIKEAFKYGFGRGLPPAYHPAIAEMLKQLRSAGKDINSIKDTAPQAAREDNLSYKSPFEKNYVPLNMTEPARTVNELTYQPYYYEDQIPTAKTENSFPLVGEENNSYSLLGAGLAGDLNTYHTLASSNLSLKSNKKEMLNKSAVQLIRDIPESDKKIGVKCVRILRLTATLLDKAQDNANVMFSSFEEFPDTSEDKIWSERVYLRKMRDGVIDLFQDFEKPAAMFIKESELFTSDSDFNKLVKSFVSDVAELKKLINDFQELYDNMKDKDFVKNITNVLKGIVSQCRQIKTLIKDRMIIDIKTNILGEDWYSKIQTQNEEKQ